jgi:hypothetical protein
LCFAGQFHLLYKHCKDPDEKTENPRIKRK